MKTLASVVALCFASLCSAADGHDNLRGISTVRVSVSELDPDLVHAGIVQGQLQTDVELKLRGAGLRVIQGKFGPIFYLTVSSVKSEESYAVSIHAELRQSVVRTSDIEPLLSKRSVEPEQIFVLLAEKAAFATTWDDGIVIHIGAAKARTALRDYVKDLVDRFVNAWLAANPK